MRRTVLLFAVTLALLAGTGCGIEKTSTPDGFSGPSEFGTALTMTASPELLPRDGRSQSVIAITLRFIADSTGGKFFRAMDVGTTEKAFEAIDRTQKIEFQAKSYLVTTELFLWPAAPGLFLLFVGALGALPPRWTRRHSPVRAAA